ncbi:hypothetical protein LSO9J_10137 [Candidatus Liberibacter solanacearum]
MTPSQARYQAALRPDGYLRIAGESKMIVLPSNIVYYKKYLS